MKSAADIAPASNSDGNPLERIFRKSLTPFEEFVRGESASALLPAVAALGGMAVPALLYLLLNHDAAFPNAWGVPMATDIAFAVGVLMLLVVCNLARLRSALPYFVVGALLWFALQDAGLHATLAGVAGWLWLRRLTHLPRLRPGLKPRA